MNNKSMMNQTYKDLINTARAEHIPYSGTNKATLVARIQEYRDTIGTLWRDKRQLKAIAKEEGMRGYASLKKDALIDSVLYHRRVIKPRIRELKNLTRDELRRQAKLEGLKVIGSKKDRITHNLAKHRVKRHAMRDIVEDIANEEYKATEVEGTFNGNFRRFKSKGVEGKIVSIEEYLQKHRRHVLKVMRELVNSGDSWKFQLNIAISITMK